ncbi:copper transporter [Dactylosporangium cerinum]
MINFRYHVVSLAAVFLALAIGLVVGTAAANGPLAENLNDQVNKITDEKEQLRDDLDQSRAELKKNSDFATEVAPMLLNGKLVGHTALLVKIEGNDKDVDTAADGITTMLQTAGAKLTGTVTIKEKFSAGVSDSTLLDLADSTAPPPSSAPCPTTAKARRPPPPCSPRSSSPTRPARRRSTAPGRSCPRTRTAATSASTVT